LRSRSDMVEFLLVVWQANLAPPARINSDIAAIRH
jgi:hypothetical protein